MMATGDSKSVPGLVATWIKSAEDKGLIATPDPKQASLPSTELGVSLGYLKLLAKSLEVCADGRDTQYLVNKVLNLVTSKPPSNKKGRFFDWIPASSTGPPQYYAVHPWKNCWQDTINQLVEGVVEDEPDNSTEYQHKLDSTFVWIDFIALCQFRRPNVAADLNVREMVKACVKGAALVLDKELTFMSRSWCLYEAWCFVYYGDITKLTLCLPDLTVRAVCQFESANEKLDISKGESREPKDATRILTEVKSTVGAKHFHKTIQDALLLVMRSRLRWSKKLQNVALYCGVMLNMGEYGHLQQVLHGIPEINDDDQTLQEIRNIYNVYDTENNGDLNESQFAEVLALSGFGPQEALKIFDEVNTDGEGGVSLDEFETWWMASNRDQDAQYSKPVVMTTIALAENLTKMKLFLERMGMSEMSQYYDPYIQQLEKSNAEHGPVGLEHGALKGDWQNMADNCAWKLHTGDFKAAAKAIYDSLLWNADQLDEDPCQLVILDSLMNPQDVCEALAKYLRLFYELLRVRSGRKSHCDLFERFADELSNPATVAAVTTNRVQSNIAKATCGPNQQQFDFSKFSVVRDMISLKYGDEKPLEKKLIVEAEKSLGKWMASNKSRKESTQKGYADDMANHYLASYTTQNDDSALINPDGRQTLSGIMGGVKLTHEIPEEGIPYTSCLAYMGPDAQAYLAEVEAKKEGQEEGQHGDSRISSIGRSTPGGVKGKGGCTVGFDPKPPDFDSANPRKPTEGALGKVITKMYRWLPKMGMGLSSGEPSYVSDSTEPIPQSLSSDRVSSPRILRVSAATDASPARARRASLDPRRQTSQSASGCSPAPPQMVNYEHLGGAAELHAYVASKHAPHPPTMRRRTSVDMGAVSAPLEPPSRTSPKNLPSGPPPTTSPKDHPPGPPPRTSPKDLPPAAPLRTSQKDPPQGPPSKTSPKDLNDVQNREPAPDLTLVTPRRKGQLGPTRANDAAPSKHRRRSVDLSMSPHPPQLAAPDRPLPGPPVLLCGGVDQPHQLPLDALRVPRRGSVECPTSRYAGADPDQSAQPASKLYETSSLLFASTLTPPTPTNKPPSTLPKELSFLASNARGDRARCNSPQPELHTSTGGKKVRRRSTLLMPDDGNEVDRSSGGGSTPKLPAIASPAAGQSPIGQFKSYCI